MRHAHNTNRLHAVQIVHDSQAVKAESAVRKMVDILETKAVRATVGDLKTALDLLVNVNVRAEYSPNSTHFTFNYFLKFYIEIPKENKNVLNTECFFLFQRFLCKVS